MNVNLLKSDLEKSLIFLKKLNPVISGKRTQDDGSVLKKRDGNLQKVLVANRGEIAKKFFLTLHEEEIPSVAVVTDVDKGQSWYEFADEVIFIGDSANYTSIPTIIAAIILIKANAVYAGYGFLSENAEFVETISSVSGIFNQEIIFMGADHKTMRLVGDKITARKLARNNGIPLFKSSGAFTSPDVSAVKSEAARIGYPVIIKLSSGGGGKGMYIAEEEKHIEEAVVSCFRIGNELYNDPTFYIEKYIKRPVHFEVQVFNGTAIAVRKCAVQRRNQKIIEENGFSFLQPDIMKQLLSSAKKIAEASGYNRGGGAGTVEFLIDQDTGEIGFLEMNTRLQVEYAVTDQSLGIDLAKWQILFYDGREKDIIRPETLRKLTTGQDHSIECRIYAEDPENEYLPSPGTIIEMMIPTFNGIRCDFGFSEGDTILSEYDPMIGKLISNGSTRKEALIRLDRALQELYIKGVKTNINQLLKIIRHPKFKDQNYSNNLLLENPELNYLSRKDVTDITDRRSLKPLIFCAFTEYIRLLHDSIREYMIIAGGQGIMATPLPEKQSSIFTAEYRGRHTVEFLQVSLDTFYAHVDGSYNGKLTLSSFNDRNDDFIVIFGNSSYRLRVDRYAEYIILRMKDNSNKIDYYRMHISVTKDRDEDKSVIIKSPFQGRFICFGKDDLKINENIKKGAPLVILSSMKMETTLRSPVDGKITYLLGGGDIRKLEKSGNQTGGKSLEEGEILAVIEKSNSSGEITEQATKKNKKKYHNNTNEINLVDRKSLEKCVTENPEQHLETLFELIKACMQGFIIKPELIETLKLSLEKILIKKWNRLVKITDINWINTILLHYVYVKKTFSPVFMKNGLSIPEELDRLIRKWDNNEINLSEDFESLIEKIFSSYNIQITESRTGIKRMLMQHILLLTRRSFLFTFEHPDLIENLVYIISGISASPEKKFSALNQLLEQEQGELEDSLVKFIKKIISQNYPDYAVNPFCGGLSKEIPDNAKIKFPQKKVLQSACENSLISPERDLIPISQHPEIEKIIQEKVSILNQRFHVSRLQSYYPGINIFKLISKNNDEDKKYCAMSFTETDKKNISIETAEKALFDCAECMAVYQAIEPGINNWIEINLAGKDIIWDIEQSRGTCFNYFDIRRICFSALKRLINSPDIKGIINAVLFDPATGLRTNKGILFYRENESIILDLIQPDDKFNPYCIRQKNMNADKKLLDKRKWPVEIWADECFDSGSAEEIIIKSIDFDNQRKKRSVGSKLYKGSIHGSDAFFYMKDSRINGGSTGDLEGQKFIAACYISYIKNRPLFVWNDGAGANILEGVVSLNRGAEGFMMNSLLSQNKSIDKFLASVNNSEDPVLQKLFNEIRSDFNLEAEGETLSRKILKIIAVGIGPSAGLDVYGSSQAAIQILLDSDESYRVLTGSNIIKAVMGEEISNYDIGGAKILGKWTGIVDIIATDKIHLVSCIRQLHNLFCNEVQLEKIVRKPEKKQDMVQINHDEVVITEDTVKDNIDNRMYWKFKEDYYASDALLAGFARIGGRRIFIAGPRTDAGLRSTASINKLKELLQMAYRTSTHQIFITGKKWQQTPDYHENMNMRERLDVMNTLRNRSSLRIIIITQIQGLKNFDLNSTADVIIFINNGKLTNAEMTFVRKNSTFILSSFNEAFDLSSRIIMMFDPIKITEDSDISGILPSIPADKSEPYDIKERIINTAFDKDTFIEFSECMNDPLFGPNLVTGIAQLQGHTVGIIADQPLIKGGGADASGTEKFRVFTELLNRNNIPLVMLSNSSGFVPGSKQERFRIQSIGAESLNANILGEIPVVSVVLNQNYGGRLIQAFNRFLRPGIVYLALENAHMAVLGAEAAFALLYSKKFEKISSNGQAEAANIMKSNFIEEYNTKSLAKNDALSTGVLDWIIPDVSDLRNHLIKALDLAKKKIYELKRK